MADSVVSKKSRSDLKNEQGAIRSVTTSDAPPDSCFVEFVAGVLLVADSRPIRGCEQELRSLCERRSDLFRISTAGNRHPFPDRHRSVVH